MSWPKGKPHPTRVITCEDCKMQVSMSGNYIRRCSPCRKKANAFDKLLCRYGITRDVYYAQLTAQGGGCAICHAVDDLVVDHDHYTEQFRGILCRKCNGGLGLLGDTTESVQRALSYLIERTRI